MPNVVRAMGSIHVCGWCVLKLYVVVTAAPLTTAITSPITYPTRTVLTCRICTEKMQRNLRKCLPRCVDVDEDVQASNN